MDSSIAIWSERGILPPSLRNNKLLSCFVAPNSAGLPSIPENRNLTELVVAVTDENIVGLFAALLAERRVLLTSSKLSTVRRDLLSWERDTRADSQTPFIQSLPMKTI